MKNLKTYEEFVNEKYNEEINEAFKGESEFSVEDTAIDGRDRETMRKVLGVKKDTDILTINSEDEADGEDPMGAFKKAEKAFNSNGAKEIDGFEGAEYDSKSKLIRFVDYGVTSYFWKK